MIQDFWRTYIFRRIIVKTFLDSSQKSQIVEAVTSRYSVKNFFVPRPLLLY